LARWQAGSWRSLSAWYRAGISRLLVLLAQPAAHRLGVGLDQVLALGLAQLDAVAILAIGASVRAVAAPTWLNGLAAAHAPHLPGRSAVLVAFQVLVSRSKSVST
jgi:hypothetical protein